VFIKVKKMTTKECPCIFFQKHTLYFDFAVLKNLKKFLIMNKFTHNF